MRKDPCRVKVVLFLGLLTGAGCAGPLKRPPVTHPQGTLRVLYEQATTRSSCLVAGATMAANYLLGERRFTEPQMRAAMRAAGWDETVVADVKAYLAAHDLYLVTLAGTIDGKPPLGLRYWLQNRGYPVICVVNQHGGDPRLNHAVVVSGILANEVPDSADIVYYLDPSTPEPLQTADMKAFDQMWAYSDRAMMLVVAPPSESLDGATPADGARSPDGAASLPAGR